MIIVRFWRITTHGLYIPLRNLIVVDFPRRLVDTHSLVSIHSFGPFRAAPPRFLTIMLVAHTVQFRSIRHPSVIVTRLTKFSFRRLALGAVTGSEFRQVRLGISIF